MDIEHDVLPYVFALAGVREWPELRAVIQRAASPNAGVWGLPALACEAVGGTANQAVPAVAAVGCLQLSIIVIDDLLDNDPRGEHHRLGAPAAANLAVGLQAAGLQAIVESRAGDAAKLAALAGLNRMALTTALGQNWDTQNPADEDAYWRLVRPRVPRSSARPCRPEHYSGVLPLTWRHPWTASASVTENWSRSTTTCTTPWRCRPTRIGSRAGHRCRSCLPCWCRIPSKSGS